MNRLNHTTSLHRLSSSGDSEAELKLFDSDFAAKLDRNQSPSHEEKYRFMRVLATANVIPRGEDLVLTASRTNLPTVEINQHGVVRELPLSLPKGTVLYALLPNSDIMLHAIVGKLTDPPLGTALSPGETPDAPQSFFPTEIDEFYPQDGSLARRIKVESGPMPVCAINGSYTFIVPRGQDGKLQVLHAKPTQ